ncbi:MAG: hypothetical protein ACQGVK_22045 [Myxococcota bacterium]
MPLRVLATVVALLAFPGCLWTVLYERLVYPDAESPYDSWFVGPESRKSTTSENPSRFVEAVCTVDGELPAKSLEQSALERECDFDPDCELRCLHVEERTKPAYTAAASEMCPLFGRMELSLQMRVLHDQHLAWAEAYDLSPEQTWCLTNDDSLREQAEAFDAACASGVERSADRVLGDAYRRCDAWDVD